MNAFSTKTSKNNRKTGFRDLYINDNFVLVKNDKDIDNVMLLINVPEDAQSLSATDINNDKSA